MAKRDPAAAPAAARAAVLRLEADALTAAIQTLAALALTPLTEGPEQ